MHTSQFFRIFAGAMSSYLQIENISKSYGPKVLFSGIGFNINEGDKVVAICIDNGMKALAAYFD